MLEFRKGCRSECFVGNDPKVLALFYSYACRIKVLSFLDRHQL